MYPWYTAGRRRAARDPSYMSHGGERGNSAYARAVARISVAQIARGAHDELHGGNGFTLIERSACEVLLDVISRYVRTLGAVSTQAAQHASRSEVNMNDVLRALSSMHGGSLSELLEFARAAPDLQFPRDVAQFPCVPASKPPEPGGQKEPTKRRAAEPRPQHVPDFFPPFPEPCTYRCTATHNKRAVEPQQARKERAKLKRQAQESLLGLQQGESADGAALGAAPLPSLHSEPSDGVAMHEGGGGAAAASTTVPDVLAPGIPAVLQSNAASECSGIQTASAVPASTRPGSHTAPVAPSAAAGSSTRRSKQEAILGLQHLHDLDEVEKNDDDD